MTPINCRVPLLLHFCDTRFTCLATRERATDWEQQIATLRSVLHLYSLLPHHPGSLHFSMANESQRHYRWLVKLGFVDGWLPLDTINSGAPVALCVIPQRLPARACSWMNVLTCEAPVLLLLEAYIYFWISVVLTHGREHRGARYYSGNERKERSSWSLFTIPSK